MDNIITIIEPLAIQIFVILLSMFCIWLLDNKINKPSVSKIVVDVLSRLEAETSEGTFLDMFLDEFLKRKGKEPSAGELKSALDLSKNDFKITFNKQF